MREPRRRGGRAVAGAVALALGLSGLAVGQLPAWSLSYTGQAGVPVVATPEGVVPELPETVAVTTDESTTVSVPVEWEALEPGEFTATFEKVTVSGTASGEAGTLPVSASVWVVPDNLVYLIDTGRVGANGSEIVDAARALRGDALLNDAADRKVTAPEDSWGYIERNPSDNQKVSVTPGNAADWATSYTGDDNDADEGLVYRMTLDPGEYRIVAAHVPRRTQTHGSWLNVNGQKVDEKTVAVTQVPGEVRPPVFVTHELTLTERTTISYESQKLQASGGFNAHVSLLSVERLVGVVAPPTISPDGGFFHDPQTVTLSHASSEAEVYYTVDGTEPDRSSTRYTAPFSVTESATVRAVAYLGDDASAVAETEITIAAWSAAAIPFKLRDEDAVSHVKLTWEPLAGAERYEVRRDGEVIGVAKGDTFDDYDLAVGRSYDYDVQAYAGDELLATTVAVTAETFQPTGVPTVRDNVNGYYSAPASPGGFKYGDTYYSFAIRSTGSGVNRVSTITERTSPDGFAWGAEQVLATYPDSKFEGVSMLRHPVTDKIVIVAHYENGSDYSLARFFLAEVTPQAGGSVFEETFLGRPLGNESRDIGLFIEGADAYLLSATRGNRDIAIYALNSSWTEPVELVATAFRDQHRETPAITKRGDTYYFFSSKASGWYPSQAAYATAKHLAGPWTPLREIGNAATFGTQSIGIGTGWRWGANFRHPESRGNFSRVFPVAFNDGFATMEFFPQIEYYPGQGAVPVQAGRIVSVGKPVTASSAAAGSDPAVVTDGSDLAGAGRFTAGSYPYDLTVDLGEPTKVVSSQITTRLVGGSETAYKYTLSGSLDGVSFTPIVDKSTNWAVGFLLDQFDEVEYRYLRFSVTGIVNVQNENPATWADGVIEWALFGGEKAPVAGLAIEPSATTRCVAGKVVVAVTARNADEAVADVTLASAFGGKEFADLQPGTARSAAFSTRAASVTPGTVAISATAADGRSLETTASYPATSCG